MHKIWADIENKKERRFSAALIRIFHEHRATTALHGYNYANSVIVSNYLFGWISISAAYRFGRILPANGTWSRISTCEEFRFRGMKRQMHEERIESRSFAEYGGRKNFLLHRTEAEPLIKAERSLLRHGDMQLDLRKTQRGGARNEVLAEQFSDAFALQRLIDMEFAEFRLAAAGGCKSAHAHDPAIAQCYERIATAGAPSSRLGDHAAMKIEILDEPLRIAFHGIAIKRAERVEISFDRASHFDFRHHYLFPAAMGRENFRVAIRQTFQIAN